MKTLDRKELVNVIKMINNEEGLLERAGLSKIKTVGKGTSTEALGVEFKTTLLALEEAKLLDETPAEAYEFYNANTEVFITDKVDGEEVVEEIEVGEVVETETEVETVEVKSEEVEVEEFAVEETEPEPEEVEVEEVGETEVEETKTEKPKKKTGLGKWVIEELRKGTFKDKTNEQIAEKVRKKFNSSTKAKCITWFKAKASSDCKIEDIYKRK